MSGFSLSKRLLSVAALVRQGACFADIGTDHAYLPLYLKEQGVISRAVCSDINEGPLSSAISNVREAGLSDSFEFILTDGARGIENKGVTDVAVCGMGGELIAKIIEESPFLKSSDIRLLLQPMTRAPFLRRYLAKNGFTVLSEVYSYDSGKYYIAFSAEYTGAVRILSDFEAEFGDDMTRASFSPEKRGYFEAKISSLLRAARGKAMSGETCSPEARLLSELKSKIDIFEINIQP